MTTINKKSIKRCREELEFVVKQIAEKKKPLVKLKTEINQIGSAIQRGKMLKDTNYVEYERNGGDVKINELENLLNMRINGLETLEEEIRNHTEPLLITESNILAFLAQKKEKSQLKKKKEEENGVKSKSPIDLVRWAKRTRWKYGRQIDPLVWKAIGLAQKRENQILVQINELYGLKLVRRDEMSKHYADKYRKYRFSLFGRGCYLLPVNSPTKKKVYGVE